MSVNVDIPGVGTVRAQNAAQEDTLKALLSATVQSQQKARRADADLSNMMRRQAAAADDATSSFSTMSASAKSATTTSASYYSRLKENLDFTTSGISAVGDQARQFGTELLSLSKQITLTWTKTFTGDQFIDPVQKSARAINLAIGLATKGVDVFGSAIGGAASSLGLGKLGELFGKSISGAGQVAGTVLTEINDHMANELSNTIKNYQQFNKMGASFSEGMSDLRLYATAAGMTVDQFTTAVKASRQSIGTFGANIADGSLILAKYSNYMNEFNAQGAKGGTTFRQELRLMGYSLEEQTELTANYLASLRGVMSAEQIRQMDAKKVAEGTRQYAADLKVLADITGQDAKAAQERARAASMEADIMAQLKTPEEVEKFQAALRSMPDYAKKGFLEYVSSGGQVITDQATNVFMAQNAKLAPMYEQGLAQIRDANVKASQVQTDTLNRAREVGEEQRKIAKEGNNAISQASRLGATGLGEYSKMINEAAASGLYSADATQRSADATQNQTQTQEKLTRSMNDAAESAQKFAVFTQDLSGKYLPQYAELLKETTNLTTNLLKATAIKIDTAIETSSNITGAVEKLLKELGGVVKQGMIDGWKLVEGRVLDYIYGTTNRNATPERPPGRASGGPVLPNMPYIVGEQGPELRLFDTPGTIAPSNALSGLLGQLRQSDVTSTRQIQETFTSAIQSLNKQKDNTADTKITAETKESVDELPTALQQAFERVLSGPTGFVAPFNEFKNQFAEDNKLQQSMLQEQIDKLKDLISAMNENTRANERIATELS